MRLSVLRVLAGVCLLIRLSYASSHADPTSTYQRIICVVPMVGAGTLEDPKRPLFAPVSGLSENAGESSKGFTDVAKIVAYHSVLSDDGTQAIVEFVARDRAAFAPLLGAKRQGRIQLFDAIHGKPDEVLQELRKVKKSFDFQMLRVGAM